MAAEPELKALDLVWLKAEWRSGYVGVLPTKSKFVYLGDIQQMKGHGVFVSVDDHKTYAGFHTDSFERVPADEV